MKKLCTSIICIATLQASQAAVMSIDIDTQESAFAKVMTSSHEEWNSSAVSAVSTSFSVADFENFSAWLENQRISNTDLQYIQEILANRSEYAETVTTQGLVPQLAKKSPEEALQWLANQSDRTDNSALIAQLEQANSVPEPSSFMLLISSLLMAFHRTRVLI